VYWQQYIRGEMMQKYISVLKNCSLFRGIEDNDMVRLLDCMDGQVKSFQAEEYIFLAGDKINYVGIVLSGMVEIMKENLAGNKHILAFLEPSDMFAEGIVCTGSRIAPVTVRVKEAAEILFIPYERIIKSCGNSCVFHISLIRNMMVVLGEKNVNLNRKLELLTLKGMREKIASYLINESNERGSGMFQILLNRTELADYLNVSRTSMCRELTRMQEEGIIDFYGRSFKILDKERLAESLE
jgi:CRP-like cAMP-binding protein